MNSPTDFEPLPPTDDTIVVVRRPLLAWPAPTTGLTNIRVMEASLLR